MKSEIMKRYLILISSKILTRARARVDGLVFYELKHFSCSQIQQHLPGVVVDVLRTSQSTRPSRLAFCGDRGCRPLDSPMDVGGDGKPPAVSFSAGPTRNPYSTYSSRDRSIEKQTREPTLKQNRRGLIAGTLPRHLLGHPLLQETQGGRESVVDWTGL